MHLLIEGSVVGHWDAERIEQVITHLLANALKHGAGGSIEVAVKRVGQRAQLVIRDHGAGIAEDDQDRIFGRFERATSPSSGGLGLGLWVVQEIIEAHGGTVRVDSAEGEGATFTVELPCGAHAGTRDVS